MRLGVLSFDKGPVTAVTLFTYFFILFLVFWTDVLPGVPKDQKGLSLQNAYADLHQIASRPHPYNSHANDHVRDFLLHKVRSIARRYPDVEVIDDLRSNGSWASPGYGVYFEGTNILVKIEGTEPRYWDKEGVLFSAHYDSVSTAPGATDDGMGVATLLQLIEYFAKHRTKRTAIFNINNGEEDWLNGAHAFLQHPWSRIPDSFLNLEGAASGGRPILFRGTSAAVLRAFRGRHVPRPHANVLSADAFARDVIRSGTDYSVYTEGAQMQGLDLAFYKRRSKYHTKFDAVPYTEGKEKSLWSMMETAKGAGSALLNDSTTHDQDRYVPAVYFDLFAARLVLFRLDSLYIFNILFLILGPILLAALYFIDAVIKAARKRREGGPRHPDHHHSSLLTRIFTDFRLIWRWAKFWVAIIITIGVQALLILIFVKANPYIIYSNPYIVLFCLTVVSFITFTWTIKFDLPASHSDHEEETEPSDESQKETVLLQSYTLSWILVLLATIAIGKAQIGGSYLLTYWSVGLWVACGLASLETVFEFHDTPKSKAHSRLRSRSRSRSTSRSTSTSRSRQRRRHEEATERTPLTRDQDNEHNGSQGLYGDEREMRRELGEKEGDTTGWWLFQFVLAVPAPLIMAAHIANMLLDATSQTLADGNSKAVVYATASLVGFFLVLPLAPFSFKLFKGVGWILLCFSIMFTLWGILWVFPFDAETPLKIYFQQIVQLEGAVTSVHFPNASRVHDVNRFYDTTTSGVVRNAVTSLYGAPEYLRNDIIPKLPSSNNKQIDCYRSYAKAGLLGCNWDSGYEMVPQPGSAPKPDNGSPSLEILDQTDFFRAEVTRTSPTSAEIVIRGKNTRNCRIYFDNRPIVRYTISGSVIGMQPHYGVHEEGVKELRLWSRDWDKVFVVDVEWRDYMGLGEGLSGRLACEWAEYASASAGVPGQGGNPAKGGFRSAKIPALEEVLSFLPTWVVVSKFSDGLVEAWESFEV